MAAEARSAKGAAQGGATAEQLPSAALAAPMLPAARAQAPRGAPPQQPAAPLAHAAPAARGALPGGGGGGRGWPAMAVEFLTRAASPDHFGSWDLVARIMNSVAGGGGAAGPFSPAECQQKVEALRAGGGLQERKRWLARDATELRAGVCAFYLEGPTGCWKRRCAYAPCSGHLGIFPRIRDNCPGP